MNYAYDILLNFLEGSRIYDFFEWQKKDNIINIDKIPIFLISEKAFLDIIENEVVIEKDFLNIIKNKTKVFENRNRIIEYASIITNGEKSYGIKLDKNGRITGKSSLLLDEEEEITELSKNIKETEIKYEIKKYKENKKRCLRIEEERKNFIIKELERALKENNKEKLNYIYKEVLKNKMKNNNYEKIIEIVEDGNSKVLKKLYFILKLSSNVHKERKY